MKAFNDRIVLVTGSGSGIGRETAALFAKMGAQVIVSDIDENSGNDTVRVIRQMGGRAEFIYCDVSSRESIAAFSDRVHRVYNHVDVLVNNAGIGAVGNFINTQLDTWERVINVNLMGVVVMCHYFLPKMIASGEPCHVVNVASAAAFFSPDHMSIYGTTKAAVLGFTEILQLDMAKHNIDVSAICPGIVNTAIVERSKVETECPKTFVKRASKLYSRRNYPPSKVAKAIVKAVRSGGGIKPVTPEAWMMYYVKRVSPGLWPRLWRFKGRGKKRISTIYHNKKLALLPCFFVKPTVT